MKARGPVGGTVATLALLAFGLWALFDTTRYSDADSVVFPRTVGIALVVLCAIALAARRSRAPGVASGLERTDGLEPAAARDGDGDGGSPLWRRVLLIGSMLLAPALMATLGFLPAALLAFAGGLVAARHGRTDTATLVRHALAGLAIVVGFYALFRYGLKVPLP